MRIYEDLRVIRLRLSVLQYGLAVLLALLLANFWHLQVLRAKHFRSLAESNRIRSLALAAPRGHLLDRTGLTLVENRPSFNILLSPEDSPDLERTVVWLSRLLGLDEASLRARAAQHRSLREMLVKANASLEEVTILEARRFELPAVTVVVVPLRSYPLAAAAAHTLGRVGEVRAQQLHSPEFADLKPGDLVGQAGIEALYNSSLMGRDGLRRVIVDSLGLEVGEAERRRPEPGPNLTLTLDSELQTATERAFAGRAGAAVVLDPNTGAILAMTSTPAYDPNEFTTGIDTKRWATLRTDPDTPLMNRVIQGQYAPGSIFKIVVAAAALEEGLVTPRTRIRCSGVLWLYDTAFHCNVAGGHGRVALREALARSCNVYFYHLGVQLGIRRIARYARRMGLGDVTRVDLPHEVSGLVPSPEWKLRTRSAPWYEGETVSVSIGQGQLSVTPLQAARLAAVVASGGQLPRPYLVSGIGSTRLEREPPRDLGFRAETVEAIKDGMCAGVAVGTGWRSRLPGIRVCGKTGSAQVVGRASLGLERDNPKLLAHAWFVAFAPADSPRVAVAVLVENGSSGGATAAPVARRILESYFRLASSDPTVPTTGRVSSLRPWGHDAEPRDSSGSSAHVSRTRSRRGEPAMTPRSRP